MHAVSEIAGGDDRGGGKADAGAAEGRRPTRDRGRAEAHARRRCTQHSTGQTAGHGTAARQTARRGTQKYGGCRRTAEGRRPVRGLETCGAARGGWRLAAVRQGGWRRCGEARAGGMGLSGKEGRLTRGKAGRCRRQRRAAATSEADEGTTLGVPEAVKMLRGGGR